MNVGNGKLKMCKTKYCLKGVLNIQRSEAKSMKHEAAKLISLLYSKLTKGHIIVSN